MSARSVISNQNRGKRGQILAPKAGRAADSEPRRQTHLRRQHPRASGA